MDRLRVWPELASGFELKDVRGDLLIGVYEDVLGVERVAVHRVRR